MTEEAPVQAPEDIPVAVPGEGSMSARDAARALAGVRWGKPQAEAPENLNPELPTLAETVADAQSGEEPVDAAPETEPGETTETTEPAEELPPIDPPRSWSKEWKEEFQNYPRDLQEKVAAREQERETALRRGQNEAAEQRKALEAQLAQANEVRKQNEDLYPQLLALFQQQQQAEFSDIKTMADVEKMAREDWPRFSLFQAHQMKLQQAQQLAQAAQQRQQQEYQQQWTKFAAEEDAKFIGRHPEMADPEKAAGITGKAQTYLRDLGFSDEELGKIWSGQNSVSARDARIQDLIYDGMRYREAKAAVPKAAVKPVPKVQRPGSPVQRAPEPEARERAIFNQLDQITGINARRLGAQLIAERRAAKR